MLFKFKSQATADVIMLEGPAHRILHIVGKDPSAKGIITVAQIPRAIEQLQAAVDADEAENDPHAAQHFGEHHATHAEAVNGNGVTLHQHAVPFIDMLRRSAEAGKDVVWGV